MLTQQDFEQLTKIIQKEVKKIVKEEVREIVREEVGNESQSLKDSLESEMKLSRMHIQNDIDELSNRIKNLEIRVTRMHKELKEEIKLVVHVLDKDNIKTLKRVKVIEEQLGITA